jgi:hypothetical protein
MPTWKFANCSYEFHGVLISPYVEYHYSRVLSHMVGGFRKQSHTPGSTNWANIPEFNFRKDSNTLFRKAGGDCQ